MEPLTRKSGEGGEFCLRALGDELVDGFAAGPAILDGSLPLPSLIERLKLFKVYKSNRWPPLCGADLAAAVAFETFDQVVRAAVVAMAVVAE
jgi:hypothetical protein